MSYDTDVTVKSDRLEFSRWPQDRRTPGTPEVMNADVTGTYDGISTGKPTHGELILSKAQRLVYGDREAAYSHPYDDFTRIGNVWGGYLGVTITPQDVAQMMILLKACRVRVDVLHGRAPKEDTMVDEAGYAECAARVADREYGSQA